MNLLQKMPQSLIGTLILLVMLEPPAHQPTNEALRSNEASPPVFLEVADVANLHHRNETWGWAWGDYDGDGYLDLFLGNHPEQGVPPQPEELHSYLMRNDGDLDLFVTTFRPFGTNSPNHLYSNNGDGPFEDVAMQSGVAGVREGADWGTLWADYDNDGFLDLLTSQATWPWPLEPGSYELFRNQGNENHWLKVDLQDVSSNSGGIGAQLWLTIGGQTQFREVSDSSHYFNHYSGPVQFGLGDHYLWTNYALCGPPDKKTYIRTCKPISALPLSKTREP
ncbi:MAG: CRTAC1 family protein [Chloroflexi bacterium]|nr:CRTAC1 family protein [Chloroflexota bacterium]